MRGTFSYAGRLIAEHVYFPLPSLTYQEEIYVSIQSSYTHRDFA
jgi:hypothetical protein